MVFVKTVENFCISSISSNFQSVANNHDESEAHRKLKTCYLQSQRLDGNKIRLRAFCNRNASELAFVQEELEEAARQEDITQSFSSMNTSVRNDLQNLLRRYQERLKALHETREKVKNLNNRYSDYIIQDKLNEEWSRAVSQVASTKDGIHYLQFLIPLRYQSYYLKNKLEGRNTSMYPHVHFLQSGVILH